MKNLNLPTNYTGPVVIGGLGGSGTRLITKILNELGFYLGDDLNESYDNLWFTLLFKRVETLAASEEEFTVLTEILLKGMTGCEKFTKNQIDLINQLALTARDKHSVKWLKKRALSLLSKKKTKIQSDTRWGWKEPNSHVFLDRLLERFTTMKYIHVVRNGLDMAYSSNQHQLTLWGQHFLGENHSPTPRSSLEFWCITNKRIVEISKSMGTNFLFLNYDNFCTNPETGITELYEFLGLNDAIVSLSSLSDLIRVPSSIGRFKQFDTNIFAEEDVAYVKKLGFDTGER